MGIKSELREMVIRAVQYALRTELKSGESRNEVDKIIKYWTWERYGRTKQDIASVNREIDKCKQDIMELVFENKKVPYLKGEKIRVALLFQIPSCWPSIESMWNVLLKDDRFDPVLLLYDKEQREKAQMEGAREFLESNKIDYVDAEEYDFTFEKPHILIYQTPYDDLHRPEFLKSDTIKRMGIRVAYVPYGIEYSASVKKEFILSTVQLRAKPWMTFALSDSMKREHRYKSKYGADYIRVTGYPKFDSIYNSEDYPLEEEVRQRINGRKIVFWQMHFPALNGDEFYPEPNLDVYLVFLKKVPEYKDLFFVLRPHPKLFETYISRGYEDKVDEFIEIMNGTENILNYTYSDYRPALFAADYVIGDRSALMIEAGALDIPVLYMTNFYHKEKMLGAVSPLFESYYQGSECCDMERFIDMVVKRGVDYKKAVRTKACRKCIPYIDGRCGARIVECMAEAIMSEE